jgi:hypothetical protein
MNLMPGARKLVLTLHVTSSVGWLGAVLGFLALALTGLVTRDEAVARAAYVAANLTTWDVLVPLSLLSLATGLLGSLGTSWGLVRHYWVVVKLVLTPAATLLLLLHTRPIGWMARAALGHAPLGTELGQLRMQLVLDAAGAAVVLLGATALSIYKPRGVTRYGIRPAPRAPSSRGHGPAYL